MIPLAIDFPNIDPVLFQIGPLAIRWYALSYIAGIVLGWFYVRRLVETDRLWWPDGKGPPVATRAQIDDLVVWIILGVIVGGRLGFVLFYGLVYQPNYYFENPLRIFMTWEGGMSFHGGLIGVLLAGWMFARRHAISIARLGDCLAVATPFGLFFGRIANFINGELWGKPSDVPWAMVFPSDPEQVTRHPSQLYEAALEGLLLFVVLRVLTHTAMGLRRPGLATGVFLIGYGIARSLVEIFFRHSDATVPVLLTMGVLLSVPMIAIGGWLVWRALKNPPAAVAASVSAPVHAAAKATKAARAAEPLKPQPK